MSYVAARQTLCCRLKFSYKPYETEEQISHQNKGHLNLFIFLHAKNDARQSQDSTELSMTAYMTTVCSVG